MCYIDRRRLEKLNSILKNIASSWGAQTYYTSPRVLHIRDIVAHHKFELQFSGSRAQRRADARLFIYKFGKDAGSAWEYSRSNGRVVFRLRVL
jgi:hypothetical protein